MRREFDLALTEGLPLLAVLFQVCQRDQLVSGDAQAKDVGLFQVGEVLEDFAAEELSSKVPAIAFGERVGISDLREEPRHAEVGELVLA